MQIGVCPFCGVGCEIGFENGKIHRVNGISSDHKLCIKGLFAHKFIDAPDRLKGAYISKDFLENINENIRKKIEVGNKVIFQEKEFFEISYKDAAFIVAEKIKEIKIKYSEKVFAFIGGARTNCESVYLFQKFAREIIKTNNIDNCARVCHSPSLKGLYEVFGTGASSISYKDLENTEVILIIGANPFEAHPVIFKRILEAKKKKDIKIITIDIVPTKTTKYSDKEILIPPLFNLPFLRLISLFIYENKLFDKKFLEKHTNNFKDYFEILKREKETLIKFFEKYEPSLISKAKEISKLISTKKTCFVWGLGVTEHIFGSETVMEIAYLSLLTNNILRKYTGVMPLRGQNNVQGACDMGALPNYLPGYAPLSKEKEGLKTPEIIKAIKENKIKFLWIMGEDLLHSHADIDYIDQALDNLELLVVNDIFPVKIVKKAHIVFGIKSTLEKDGIYINAERRVHLGKAFIENKNLLDDWEVVKLVENYLKGSFKYKTNKEIWHEVENKVDIFKGITYEFLEKNILNSPQWPLKEHIFEDGFFTKDKKANFIPFSIKEVLNYIETSYKNFKEDEFILTTVRFYEHYNICSQTERIENLKRYNERINEILISKKYMKKLKKREVYLERNGKKVGPFKIKFKEHFPENIVVAYMHHKEINKLFDLEKGDRYTKTYEFKFLPVRLIEK